MESSGLEDILAGGLGGLACVLAGQPMDTIKVKQQVHPQLYRSFARCASETYLEGGLRGFYAGSAPAIVSNVAENAVLFVFYGQILRLVQRVAGVDQASELTVFQRASAGSMASFFSSVAITPPDRVKCKLQARLRSKLLVNGVHKARHQTSSWTIVKEIVGEEGFRGLLRGLTSTWAREVPGYFFFFGGYAASRKLLTPLGGNSDDLSLWRLTLAGGLAGCCFWAALFPVDTVKSRIQVKNRDLSSSLFVTMFKILRHEGVAPLYRGLFVCCLRSFPANGALFVTYEYTRSFLSHAPRSNNYFD